VTLRRLIRRTFARSASSGVAMPGPIHRKLAANMEILGNALGQSRTFDGGRPVDADGQPIPWFTYPAIEYLTRFDMRGWAVFEYGSGQSTAWWSRRGANVVSVEHDSGWHAEMQARALPGTTLLHRDQRDAYVGALAGTGASFDVVVIDGVFREHCAAVAGGALKPGGMLILDNSDWYHEAASMIRAQGFHEASFSGFGPVNDYTWSTSVFFPGALASQQQLAPPEPIGGNPIGPGARGPCW
jgi:hypothetical protein